MEKEEEQFEKLAAAVSVSVFLCFLTEKKLFDLGYQFKCTGKDPNK